MVIVIECESCHSRYRLAKSLFKKSKAIGVRCRKCGGYIVVENPSLKDTEEVQHDFSRPVRPTEVEKRPKPAQEPVRMPPPAETPTAAHTPGTASSRVSPSAEAAEKSPEKEPPVSDANKVPRAMANLFKGINTATTKVPDTSSAASAEKDTPGSTKLSPELMKPEEQSGWPEYSEPVGETPSPESFDGSEALASVLEDLFRTQPSEPSAFPEEPGDSPEPETGQFLPLESERHATSWKTLPASSPRPPYLSPLFLFIVVFWILLLAAAALFFGTDYFERWFPTGDLRPAAMAFSKKPAAKPSFEVRSLKWFHESTFDGKALFAVTGTVTNWGKPVSWIQVQATIMGKDNVVLMDKLVAAGNQIDNTLLRAMNQEEIEANLSKQISSVAVDQTVETGRTLPFMAVFFDPPKMVYAVVVKATAGEDS